MSRIEKAIKISIIAITVLVTIYAWCPLSSWNLSVKISSGVFVLAAGCFSITIPFDLIKKLLGFASEKKEVNNNSETNSVVNEQRIQNQNIFNINGGLHDNAQLNYTPVPPPQQATPTSQTPDIPLEANSIPRSVYRGDEQNLTPANTERNIETDT